MKSITKTLIITIILLILATVFFSYKKLTPKYENIAILERVEHPGKKLMETHCYACHNPITSHDNRLAPPMIAVKKHYKNENTSKKEFINNFKKWVESPSEELTKMPGAIRKFGIMPYTPFLEKDIEQIADYIYDNEIEQPEWFKKNFSEEQKKSMNKKFGKRKTKNL